MAGSSPFPSFRLFFQFLQRLLGLNWIQQGLLVTTAAEEGGSWSLARLLFTDGLAVFSVVISVY